MKYEKGLNGLTYWRIRRVDEDDDLLPYLVSFVEEIPNEGRDYLEITSTWMSENSVDILVESTKKIESMGKPLLKRGDL